MIPSPIHAQLQAILQQTPEADPIALVWPDPVDLPDTPMTLHDIPLRLVHCASELAIREQLTEHRPGGPRLVILSPLDETRLARDVLARLWRCEPRRINPFRILQELPGVREIDPRLAARDHRWMAECLVDHHDRYREHIGFGAVLDLERAWEALGLALLDVREPAPDLDAWLGWSLRPDAGERIQALPAPMLAHLEDWWRPRLGEIAPLLATLWRTGHGGEALPTGLVCARLFRERPDLDQELMAARGRFRERYLGGGKFHNRLLAALGEAAENHARRAPAEAVRAALSHAEQALASLDMAALAVESDTLPAGFSLRLTRLADALGQAMAGKSLAPAWAALADLHAHRLREIRAGQLHTAELAVRTCGWLRVDLPGADAAAGLIRAYVSDGGFLDWARSRLWAGDEHEALNEIYRKLSRRLGERREDWNRRFAGHLEALARGDRLGDGIRPVETALETLVAPLARQRPVLLLVLDGMSQAVYRELAGHLMTRHWVELQRDGAPGPDCLLAALPSLTRVSRYSLLAGQLGEGASDAEKKAFAAHPALRAASTGLPPPQLLHKAELARPGSGALADEARERVADPRQRVVGAVINAVDDQLSSNAQLTVRWDFDALALLGQLLEAAREAERLLILCSDHGHVLDHDMRQTRRETAGERHCAAHETPGEGEIRVAGRRVVTADGAAVLPWSERIRYAQPRMGYHGGASLQELVIPVGVFRDVDDTAEVAGWREVPAQYPDWWQPPETPAPAPVPARPARDNPTADLFAAPPAAPDNWIDTLLASPHYAEMQARQARLGLQDSQVRALLGLLEERGGQAPLALVVQRLALPAIRVHGFLAGVRRLLNVDGYPVLSVDRVGQTVKLDRDTLKIQFGL